MSHRSGRGWRPLLLLLAWLPALALAALDPPARVGRLALVENTVDFLVDRNDQGSPATPNWPISSGAGLVSGRHGRAEAWIGSTAFRLAGDSRVEFSTVDDRQVDVRLDYGSLSVSLLDRDQVADLTVYTPHGRLRFAAPGRYRIDVQPEQTELRVQAGRAELANRDGRLPLGAGQTGRLFADGRLTQADDHDDDEFDRWVADRENATLASASRRHVSPQLTGYQDLDAYGDWQTTPDYGSVWYPRRVTDDWAPYRFGRWAWIAPWGWTWIDRSPWGFAPFHYGRWLLIGGRWAWLPGSPLARPVYAPALVGWIGNPGWSLSFSTGPAAAVGWFPLAPHEVYIPAHRHSTGYVHRINGGHVHDHALIDRARRGGGRPHFVHRDSPRAVTVAPASVVRDGRPIDRAGRDRLDRLPPGRHAPDSRWLRPNDGATRPQGDERRDPPNRRSGRDSEPPARPGAAPGTPAPQPRTTPAVNPPRTIDEREHGPDDGHGRLRGADRRPGSEPTTSPRPPQRDRPTDAGPPAGRSDSRPDREPEGRRERVPGQPGSVVPERRPAVTPGARDDTPRSTDRPSRRPPTDPGTEPPNGRRRVGAPSGDPRERLEGEERAARMPPPERREVRPPTAEPDIRRHDPADLHRAPRRDEGFAPRRPDSEPPASRPPARPAAPAAPFQPAPRPAAAPTAEPRQPARDTGRRHDGGERGGGR